MTSFSRSRSNHRVNNSGFSGIPLEIMTLDQLRELVEDIEWRLISQLNKDQLVTIIKLRMNLINEDDIQDELIKQWWQKYSYVYEYNDPSIEIPEYARKIRIGPNIRDEDLVDLTELIYLDLGNNPYITDTGLRHKPNLRFLKLGVNSQITIESLYSLFDLIYLDLGFNQNITDEGLQYKPLLQYFNIGSNTLITPISLQDKSNLLYLNLGASYQSFDDFIFEDFPFIQKIDIYQPSLPIWIPNNNSWLNQL